MSAVSVSRYGMAIFWGGLTAGILDIGDALIFFGARGVHPIRLLQSIAAGLMGPRAFQGGWATALAGLGLHFLIAFCAAAVFCAASRASILCRHPVPSGLLYGALIYLVMNFVVLPLAGLGWPKPSVPVLLNGVLAVMFLVGLPIAVITCRIGAALTGRRRKS